MKSPLSKLVPELERSYTTALEQMAAANLRTDKIRALLHNAAKNGHRVIRLRLPDGVDLRNTDGAGLLKDWAKSNGFLVQWVSRFATMEGGRQETGYDVDVSWGPAELRP